MDLSKSPRTIFNVLRGKTRVKIEKVGGRPNPYRVNTPTAVIAVRGTLFDVIVSNKETQVFVHEGEVAVSSLAAPQMPVILEPGQKTRVPQGESPETPSRFQFGRNNDLFTTHQPEGEGPTAGSPNPGGQNGGDPPRDRGNNPPGQGQRGNGAGPNPPPSNPPNGPGGHPNGGGGGRHP